jgi:hypothetical protein
LLLGFVKTWRTGVYTPNKAPSTSVGDARQRLVDTTVARKSTTIRALWTTVVRMIGEDSARLLVERRGSSVCCGWIRTDEGDSSGRSGYSEWQCSYPNRPRNTLLKNVQRVARALESTCRGKDVSDGSCLLMRKCARQRQGGGPSDAARPSPYLHHVHHGVYSTPHLQRHISCIKSNITKQADARCTACFTAGFVNISCLLRQARSGMTGRLACLACESADVFSEHDAATRQLHPTIAPLST